MTIPLNKLHNTVWDLFSQYIRLRDTQDDGYCYCCCCGLPRHWKRMDAGHFISRGHLYLRYNEKNVHAQCKG
ncbi:MAG: recombinase, partial [Planctomycetota bacterium]